MKYTTLVFALILVIACKQPSQPDEKSIEKQQNECDRFRTGTFKMIADGDEHEYIITRRENIQKEKTSETEVALKINWLDECSYEIITIDKNLAGPETIKVLLSNIRGDTCSYEAIPDNIMYPKQKGIFIIQK